MLDSECSTRSKKIKKIKRKKRERKKKGGKGEKQRRPILVRPINKSLAKNNKKEKFPES